MTERNPEEMSRQAYRQAHEVPEENSGTPTPSRRQQHASQGNKLLDRLKKVTTAKEPSPSADEQPADDTTMTREQSKQQSKSALEAEKMAAMKWKLNVVIGILIVLIIIVYAILFFVG